MEIALLMQSLQRDYLLKPVEASKIIDWPNGLAQIETLLD